MLFVEQVGIVLATLYAALTGLSIVLDKVVMADVLDNPGSFLITSMGSTFLLAVFAAVSFGAVDFAPRPELLTVFAIISVFKTLPIYAYFILIERADASTISPILSVQPVVTVLLAVLILGEMLASVEVLSVGVIITGVLMLTIIGFVDGSKTVKSFKTHLFANRYSLAALLLTFVWSTEAIIVKYVLSFANFWTVFFWSSLGSIIIASAMLYKSAVREELAELITASSGEKLAAVCTSEFISSVAGFVSFAAYAFAPVSLVSPIMHTYSAFVFLFILFLHSLDFEIDEKTSPTQIWRKGIATAVAFAGVVVLAIS